MDGEAEDGPHTQDRYVSLPPARHTPPRLPFTSSRWFQIDLIVGMCSEVVSDQWEASTMSRVGSELVTSSSTILHTFTSLSTILSMVHGPSAFCESYEHEHKPGHDREHRLECLLILLRARVRA